MPSRRRRADRLSAGGDRRIRIAFYRSSRIEARHDLRRDHVDGDVDRLTATGPRASMICTSSSPAPVNCCAVQSASSRSRGDPAGCGRSVSSRWASRIRAGSGRSRNLASSASWAARRRGTEAEGHGWRRPAQPLAMSRPARRAPITPQTTRRIGRAAVTVGASSQISRAAFWPDSAGDAAARVRAGAAEEQSVDRRADTAPSRGSAAS